MVDSLYDKLKGDIKEAEKKSIKEKSSENRNLNISHLLKMKYILKDYKADRVDIRPLWGDFFRLNFWKKEDSGFFTSQKIVCSIFIKAEVTLDGLIVQEY